MLESLARTVLMMSGDTSARVMINAPQEAPIASADLAPLLELMNGLPAGDALVVQREGSKGSFPPIHRPAATSIRITPENIDLTSRALSVGQTFLSGQTGMSGPQFPRNAILTAWFAEAPRTIEDMNRLVGARASVLLRDGGSVALYDVDTDKLLPRPREVIILPATPERRAALDDFAKGSLLNEVREAAGIHIETAEARGQLLVAFDRKSLDAYINDAFDPAALPANDWSVRIDPKKAVPMLEQIGDSPGLRLVAPKLFRSARDLGSWIANLEKARSIEAAASISGNAEELRVRIATK